MAKIPEDLAVTCDVCAKPRFKDANHWLLGYREGTGVSVFLWSHPKQGRLPNAHLCGQNCAGTWAAREVAGLVSERVEEQHAE